jgi:outer membrane protein
LATFMVSFVTPSVGQKSWTLEECIHYGLEHSYTVRQYEIAEDQANIERKTAEHQRYPNLSLSSSLTYNIGRSIDPTTNSFLAESFLSNGVSLSSGILLFNGMQISNSIKRADLNVKASQEDIKQVERDLAMNISRGYMAVLFASENLELAGNQYNNTKSQLDKLLQLIEAGSSPVSVKFDMEAQLAMDEQNIVVRQNDLDKAYLDLRTMMKYDESEGFVIAMPFTEGMEIIDPQTWSLEELYVSSLRNQPALEAGEYRLKGAQIGEKIAAAGFYPSLSLGGGLSTNYSNLAKEVGNVTPTIDYQTFYINNSPVSVGVESFKYDLLPINYFKQLKNNIGFGAGLQFRIPIYSNYQSKAQLATAKLNVENSRISIELEKQRLKSTIQSALAGVISAKKQLDAAKKSVQAMQVAYEQASLRFDVGHMSSYEFLDTKTRLDRANTSLLMARYEYIFNLKVLDFYMGLPLKF